MRTRLCDLFGIEFPIFAFTHCRDVAAAVSRAGGFGVLGAAALTPKLLDMELRWIDENVRGKPYGVDVLIPSSYVGRETEGRVGRADLDAMMPEEHRRFVDDVLSRYAVPALPPGERAPKNFSGMSHQGSRELVDVALSHPIKLLVSALGPPPPDIVERAHRQNVRVGGLAGKAEHARKQVEAGADVVIAQGTEAGGHTGEVSTMVLIPEVVDAVHPTPVLAAGGIGCGRQVAAALALGAEGVWTGSIWLTVREADTTPPLVERLLRATSSDTVRTRCISGKPARVLRTAWTDAWEGAASPGPLRMPLQHMLTSEAQARIHRYAHVETSRARELLGAPVGQIVGRMNAVRTAHEVVYDMVNEFLDAAGRITESLRSAEQGSGSGQ